MITRVGFAVITYFVKCHFCAFEFPAKIFVVGCQRKSLYFLKRDKTNSIFFALGKAKVLFGISK